jgi:hypothetical protein
VGESCCTQHRSLAYSTSHILSFVLFATVVVKFCSIFLRRRYLAVPTFYAITILHNSNLYTAMLSENKLPGRLFRCKAKLWRNKSSNDKLVCLMR